MTKYVHCTVIESRPCEPAPTEDPDPSGIIPDPRRGIPKNPYQTQMHSRTRTSTTLDVWV